MKLISVIVPVYNTEKYIEKCVMSILNQTYKNLEIILIDDGSTDNSLQICDSLAEMHDYLRRGCTPKVKPQKGCSTCSLKELCLPKLMKTKSVSGYLKGAMEE